MKASKRVAIIQSNYIPWKGYFNIIKDVDEFVLLDDVQYTRRDWRNRNLIKTQYGLKWLTIPVEVKGNYQIKIKDVYTAGADWRLQHWNQIKDAYQHSAHFSSMAPFFQELYLGSEETNLSRINTMFIRLINSLLGIQTRLHESTSFETPAEKTARLVHICQSLDGTQYISGIAAKEYLNVSMFEEKGIGVVWTDYSHFREYTQQYLPFEHGVSVVDLLFNEGSNASSFLKEKIWK
ncbi:MAG: WbqC family protein [Cyclobacteriaceae bacterium]|nr:WbqC family protein [Cyclobacteriaceae bacterium]